LEYEGSLETLGIYERGQPTGSAAYVPMPPPSQQIRSEEAELKGAMTGDTTSSQPPLPTEAAPSEPRPSDVRPNETPVNQALSNDAPPEQVQPQAPLSPAMQDPADEFGDLRRQRAENRRR
jgi:hypothetical protein